MKHGRHLTTKTGDTGLLNKRKSNEENCNRCGAIKTQMETNGDKRGQEQEHQIWAREEGKHVTWGTQV